MDVHDLLNEITVSVRDAKGMPMSASCLVNRAEMLQALERLRDALPVSLPSSPRLPEQEVKAEDAVNKLLDHIKGSAPQSLRGPLT